MAITNFAGTVAVITGGASGIGLTLARDLYTRGAHVVLADQNSQGLQKAGELVQEQNPESTSRILAVPTDVTKEDQVQTLMQQALSIAGHIDLVVTCAGIGRGGPIDTFTPAEARQVMDVNFMGTYNCVQAALPTMRRQGSGHFVLISSIAGKVGTAFLSAYCASKWAVRGFSYALRIELHGTGIGITTVYPAPVDTPMIHQENDSTSVVNVPPFLTPEEVATAIREAVETDRRDVTLILDPKLAALAEVFASDPDKAEVLAGEALRRRMARRQDAS